MPCSSVIASYPACQRETQSNESYSSDSSDSRKRDGDEDEDEDKEEDATTTATTTTALISSKSMPFCGRCNQYSATLYMLT